MIFLFLFGINIKCIAVSLSLSIADLCLFPIFLIVLLAIGMRNSDIITIDSFKFLFKSSFCDNYKQVLVFSELYFFAFSVFMFIVFSL